MRKLFERYKWSKYVVVLFLTAGIFGCALWVSSYVNDRKMQNIRDLQDRVATDILSSETQLGLVKELSCDEVGNTYLSKELSTLADRITYAEENSTLVQTALELKKQYSLLQVKDFVLSKQIATRCNNLPVTILYFYTDKASCPDCVKQGYVLDSIRTAYKDVRIYSFDSRIDLTAIKALKSAYGVEEKLPALVVDGVTLNGFRSLDEVKSLFPVSVTNPVAQ